MQYVRIRTHRGLALAAMILAVGPPLAAQTAGDGTWVNEDDVESGTIATMRLTVFPQEASKPALANRLIPKPFDRYDGNSAIYYLKAMGFLEQSYAKEKLLQFVRAQQELAREEERSGSQVPPYVWLEMPVAELPVEELKQYLQYTSFQPALLREAALHRRFDLERHMRTVDNPVAYLLPEIQSMRELARNQSMRCRLAIAEGRVADAVEILEQQFAMADHLGSDEFLVSALVGAAVAQIAITDALQVSQMDGAPNLYWAIAALPDPLIAMERANAYEREFLFEQVKVLKEVDATPRSTGYWQDFIDRFVDQAGNLHELFGTGPSSSDAGFADLDRAKVASLIAGSYVPSVRFLVAECGMPEEEVQQLPTAQVVFLAMVRFHRIAVDEYFKWAHVPVWQAEQNEQYQNREQWLEQHLRDLGWAAAPTGLFLPAVGAARSAQYRVDQTLGLWQTVEALRLYAAEHEGKLPHSLDRLSVPQPLDPFTGRPFAYEPKGQTAVLTTHPVRQFRRRLIITIQPE